MAHITITVCTAKRPQMLSRALASVGRLTVPPGCTLSVVVVENDYARRSLDVVERFRASSPFPIKYCLESNIGIPHARNRAIDAAIGENADWIAMLDDDEYTEPDWLLRLFEGCERFDADVATGPVKQVAEVEAPHWWKPHSHSRRTTGEFRRDAYTNNVLFNARLVTQEGLALRFDNRLTFGAEDVDFFRRAHARGARIVFVAEARVIEIVPASRLTLSRFLQRTYMVSSAGTFLDVIREGYAKTLGRRLPHGLRRICVGSFLVLAGACFWPLRRFAAERTMLKGLISVTKAWGSFSGLIGGTSNYYQRVDGA
ncbi:glycosyltransferase family 2 protein [Hyphomicrobium sp. 99]|uniref:glycosyltransferase family 2 protein n=1 Tax=Hyphomicrobium sp. 99 TaxID=1163419 RepID=UPI0006962573|nr:glycosyltransferase family A protein [Hyphomicrobium sp. 99]